MKFSLFISALLFSSLTWAKIPTGTWAGMAPNLASDYASVETEWVVFAEGQMNIVHTLGAHLSQKNYRILSTAKNTAKVVDPDTGKTIQVTFTQHTNLLKVCLSQENCRWYQQTENTPAALAPPEVTPNISLTSKWCVEFDCTQINMDSSSVLNLYTDVNADVHETTDNAIFSEKHGIYLKTVHYGYRLKNNRADLGSFSAVFRVYASLDGVNYRVLNKSGIVQLRDRQEVVLRGTLDEREIRVTFSITAL